MGVVVGDVNLPKDDKGLLKICLWREARGEGNEGITAVASVVRNRVIRRKTSYALEVMRPWQFTSMTDPNDPEYALYPQDGDLSAVAADAIAEQVIAGEIPDPTGGATLYWNPTGIQSAKKFKLLDGTIVAFPQNWNASVVQETVRIGKHIFLREL